MRQKLAYALVALSLSGGAAVAADVQSPLGVWITEGGKSHIEIYECGAHLCGRVVWLREPNFMTGENIGKPLADTRNPDKAKRSRPILGLVMIWNASKAEAPGEWEGARLYNPEDGETYKGTIKMRPDGKLSVRGYIGVSLLGKSQLWERVR